MAEYFVSIKITRARPAETNSYGDKVIKPAEFHTLLDLQELRAESLDKLQAKIHAHIDLVED